MTSPQAGKAIHAQELTKVFHDDRRGDVIAANGISFDCKFGEVFGLLGPNGAGKSTTLRMLSTVLQPTSGSASVAGFDIEKNPIDVRRSIGFLSGSTGLYGRLTAKETLEYFGRLHDMTEEQLSSRVAELLELFGIGEFQDTRCEKLSTGMKQKVSIARSVVHDPPVLIFDEPTLGLDILVASTMIEFVRKCREDGKCVIFSTHIMSEVEELCDRIGIIHRGRVQAVGSLSEIYELTGESQLHGAFMNLAERAESELQDGKSAGSAT